MAFVKLDCGILNSTLWGDREAREVFLTALLLAEPDEVREPISTIKIRSLEDDDFIVKPGWYGFVPAASTGIIRQAQVEFEQGLAALERLAEPDTESRSKEHEGRRMVRVNGGFIILNFDRFRQKDHTAAERSARYRERKKSLRHAVTVLHHGVTDRSVTQAEAEAEADKKSKSLAATPSAPLDEKKPRATKRVRLSVIRSPQDQEVFDSLWREWPREREGKPARGEKSKAEACFQEIINGGEVSAHELLEAGRLYLAEDERVKAGFPKMVSSFFALKDGFWRSAVKVNRARHEDSYSQGSDGPTGRERPVGHTNLAQDGNNALNGQIQAEAV